LENLREVYFSVIGNFLKTKLLGKFPKFLDSWGISQVSSYWGNFANLKNIPPSTSHKDSGNIRNSSNTWDSGEFPKYL